MARLFYLLNVAQHSVSKRASRDCARELGVTAAQLGALFVVGKRPDLRQSELAEDLACTKGAITSLTERLAQAGLLRARPCPEDGRATRLRLTAKGTRTVARGLPLVKAFQEELCADFSAAEVEVVARFLQRAIERTQ